MCKPHCICFRKFLPDHHDPSRIFRWTYPKETLRRPARAIIMFLQEWEGTRFSLLVRKWERVGGNLEFHTVAILPIIQSVANIFAGSFHLVIGWERNNISSLFSLLDLPESLCYEQWRPSNWHFRVPFFERGPSGIRVARCESYTQWSEFSQWGSSYIGLSSCENSKRFLARGPSCRFNAERMSVVSVIFNKNAQKSQRLFDYN